MYENTAESIQLNCFTSKRQVQYTTMMIILLNNIKHDGLRIYDIIKTENIMQTEMVRVYEIG